MKDFSPISSACPGLIFRVIIAMISVTLLSCGGDNKEEEPENKLPVVANISPTADEIVEDVSKILLTADVSDEDGTISKVEFLIDGQVVGQSVNTPYQFEWEPANSDHYQLTVRATDNNGGVSQSSTSFTAVGFSCAGSGEICNIAPRTFDNVVMAFYPSWRMGQKPINQVPFEKLTHIIFSFATPTTEGDLNTGDVDANIDALVNAAHAKGTKVYVSIGGAGGSNAFPTMILKERNRALFVDRVHCYVQDHCLDGIDIDWEHWNGTDNVIAAESNGLVTLLEELREGLNPATELSVDVYATNWFGKHYFDGIIEPVTYINTMLYDLSGPWSPEGPHSSYQQLIDDGTTNHTINSWGLMYWNGYRDWPKEKTVVGMPFYGRDFDVNNGEGVDYSTIVTRVANAGADINADKIGRAYYDGPVTAGKKAAFARDNGYAGVMFWELTGDTDVAEKSLLNAIDAELE
jgi:chitinase